MPRPFSASIRLALLILGLLAFLPLRAAEVSVAVATNFAATLEALAPRFEAATGHRMRISSGSTGQLYAQIRNGAPFQVFLAADGERPRLLEQEGRAVAGSRFTYATGRLALWSAGNGIEVSAGGLAVLGRDGLRSVAIANPRLAPYGLAARQVMQRLGRWEALQGIVVLGENIGQAYAMTATGNAQLGFVALAQLRGPGKGPSGSWFEVPRDLHESISQDAVLLRRGAEAPAARALLDFLAGPEARALIASHGYGVD